MQAIIRQGNGKYYTSAVFGYYKSVTSEDDYQRYLESVHSPYYVVFNEDKTVLIKCPIFQEGTRYLIPQLIIVDSDQSDWAVDDEGIGEVAFLSRELIQNITSTGIIPDGILNQCLQIDRSNIYNEYPEIKTQRDINNLDWASENFHDAYIAEQKLLDDGAFTCCLTVCGDAKSRYGFGENLDTVQIAAIRMNAILTGSALPSSFRTASYTSLMKRT